MLEGLLLEGVGAADLEDLHTINRLASLPGCNSPPHQVGLIKLCDNDTMDTINVSIIVYDKGKDIKLTVAVTTALPTFAPRACNPRELQQLLAACADCISAGTCVGQDMNQIEISQVASTASNYTSSEALDPEQSH